MGRWCAWSTTVVLVVVVVGAVTTAAIPVPGSYFTDEAAARLLHYDANSGDCVLFGDRRIVDEILRELVSSESPVAVVEARELTALISACDARDQGQDQGQTVPALNFPHIIYPGTKWCGTGNVAEALEDLGTLRGLDLCCRDHDLCPDDLEPGDTRHNLTNDSPFTMSECECNENFRQCLHREGNSEANEVGSAYFSTGLFQCYRLDKPIAGCLQWAGLLTQACQEYEYKDTGEQRWQIFDMKAFE